MKMVAKENTSKSRAVLGRIGCLPLLLLALPLLAAGNDSLQEEARVAALKGDWAGALAILEKAEIKAPDAVCQMIAAHACLVQNRNTGALLRLLSLRDPVASDACLEWTKKLTAEHSENAVAHYLRGDALARAARLKEALKSFDRSLQLEPRSALALSARGVARTMAGDADGALRDFVAATELRAEFADAHANLGTYWVLQRAAPGALKSFELAVKHDTAFALAYNGRGCARFAEGEYDGAIEDFEKAFELCPVLLPAGANQAVVLAALTEEAVPTQPSAQAETTIVTKSELADMDLMSQPSQPQFAKFEEGIQQLVSKGDYTGALGALEAQRSKLRQARLTTMDETGRLASEVNTARNVESTLRGFDSLLGAIPAGPTKLNILPDRNIRLGSLR